MRESLGNRSAVREGACRVEIGHIGFWRVVSCGFFLYCLKTVAGDSKDYGDVS